MLLVKLFKYIKILKAMIIKIIASFILSIAYTIKYSLSNKSTSIGLEK